MNMFLTLVLCCAFNAAVGQRPAGSPEVRKMRQQLTTLDRLLDTLRITADAAFVNFSCYDSVLPNGTTVSKAAPSTNPDSLRIWRARKATAEHRLDRVLVRLDSVVGARNNLEKKLARATSKP